FDSWDERSSWSRRMLKKGMLSKVQADADRDRRDAADLALKALEYTRERSETDFKAKVEEAKINLKKTELQAGFKIEYLEADFRTKQAIWELESSRLKEIEQQIEYCKITAPQSGLVVYYVPDQVRGGGGSQQSIVAQGEPVREGQKMVQIPDLDDMLVNVRVPEAFVDYLEKGGKRKKATIKVEAFSSRL